MRLRAGTAAAEPDLATAVRRALEHGGAGAAYLWAALPPDAPALERLSYRGSAAELQAAEDAGLEWLCLLPVLAAGGDDSPLPSLAASLFQVHRVFQCSSSSECAHATCHRSSVPL